MNELDPLTDHWASLVGVGLLGADRRPVPPPPPGPLAELAAEAPPPDAATDLLQQVAALTVVRRAGIRPAPVPHALSPPQVDERPVAPPAAGDALRDLLHRWPVLEDEWLARATAGGWRLPPELVPLMLARHRGDPHRRQVVEVLAGPLAGWLVDQLPWLAPGRSTRSAAPSTAELPLPPDLAALPAADPRQVVQLVAGGVQRGAYGAAHRAVLVLAISRVRPESLVPLADALDSVGHVGAGLARALADLARTRAALIDALGTPPRPLAARRSTSP